MYQKNVTLIIAMCVCLDKEKECKEEEKNELNPDDAFGCDARPKTGIVR